MREVVLDEIEDICVDLDVFPVKNLQVMIYLPHGLHQLAEAVRAQENRIAQRFGVDHFVAPDLFGPITNFVSWFSVSLISYLRLVQIIGLMVERSWDTKDLKEKSNKKTIRKQCSSYIERCARDVYYWRNKVGAHVAFSAPFEGDSLGTLEASLIVPVSYEAPYFWAGGFNWATGGERSEFAKWSVTKVFEELAPRLWPHRRLRPLARLPEP